MKKEEIEKIANDYVRSEYIDYGDLNENAETQIKKAVIFGMNTTIKGLTEENEMLKAALSKEDNAHVDFYMEHKPCPTCCHTGNVPMDNCPTCNGTGKQPVQ